MALPNIVYLHPADIGRHVEPYGYAVRTPNMQRIAERGVTFRNAFCTSPSCSPSRAALLTGQYPVQNGMIALTHQGCLLNDYRKHMVHTLKAAGYTTLLAGHQHIHPRLSQFDAAGREITPGQAIGFDLDWDKDDNHGDLRVREFLRSKQRTPWFIDCGFMQTHRPFPDPTADERPEGCRPLPWLPDTPETRYEMAMFLRAVNAVDVKVGYVLEALRESGQLDNTIILLTTDHGVPFPEAKAFVNDPGLGVMLILAGGPFRGGKVVDGLVSQLDVFPTLCNVLGVERPGWLEGESLLPLVDGRAQEIHEEIFGEVNFHGGYRPSRTIRTRQWRYVRNYYERTDDVGGGARPDNAASKLLLASGWHNGGRMEPEELYDMVLDPMERRNLAGCPELQDMKDELAARLCAWMERLGDPLLSGKIDPPPHYCAKAGGSREQREEHLGRLFERPGRYVSEWTGDPYARR